MLKPYIPNWKKCGLCKTFKEITAFGKNRTMKCGLQNWCKSCRKVKHKQQYIATTRNRILKSLYGIDLKTYEQMYVEQGGRCAICEQLFTTRAASVDHNHQTGEIRQLLCNTCNRTLGLLGENTEILRRMIEYLDRHA